MNTAIRWIDLPVSRGADIRTDDSRFQIVHIKGEGRLWFILWTDGGWAPWTKIQNPERFGTFPFEMGKEAKQFRALVEKFVGEE